MARKGVIKERAKEPIKDMNADHGKGRKTDEKGFEKERKKRIG